MLILLVTQYQSIDFEGWEKWELDSNLMRWAENIPDLTMQFQFYLSPIEMWTFHDSRLWQSGISFTVQSSCKGQDIYLQEVRHFLYLLTGTCYISCLHVCINQKKLQ